MTEAILSEFRDQIAGLKLVPAGGGRYEVTINGEKRKYNFRVESFPWDINDDSIVDENKRVEKRIDRLKENIESYDKNWRLVQIFKPGKDSQYVQVLFRQKT